MCFLYSFAGIPFSLCFGMMTFLSCGLIFVSCALYLMMALGKKYAFLCCSLFLFMYLNVFYNNLHFRASLDEMRVKANNLSEKPSAVLVNNEELPRGTDPPPTYRQSESLANVFVPKPTIISGNQTPLY